MFCIQYLTGKAYPIMSIYKLSIRGKIWFESFVVQDELDVELQAELLLGSILCRTSASVLLVQRLFGSSLALFINWYDEQDQGGSQVADCPVMSFLFVC